MNRPRCPRTPAVGQERPDSAKARPHSRLLLAPRRPWFSTTYPANGARRTQTSLLILFRPAQPVVADLLSPERDPRLPARGRLRARRGAASSFPTAATKIGEISKGRRRSCRGLYGGFPPATLDGGGRPLASDTPPRLRRSQVDYRHIDAVAGTDQRKRYLQAAACRRHRCRS